MEQQDSGTGPQEGGPQPGAGRGPAQDAAAVAQPSTGDPRVDEALSRLDELGGLPVSEHPAVFEQVHRRLAEALGELGPDAANH
ncbi:MAG: hypothetical protein ACM32E_06175 [Gemmatimonadota bacterium]